MWIATIIYTILVIIGIKKYFGEEKEFCKFDLKIMMLILFASAFVLRMILATFSAGHTGDLNCFTLWARRITEVGPRKFYSPDVFSDYPPGYMIILWLVGWIQKAFEIVAQTHLDHLLLRIPAILFDLATGFVLIRVAKEKIGAKQAFILGAMYLFAPAVLVNSSVWGQVDSLFTFFLIFVGYYLMQGKCEYTYIPFMLGVLLKPQMLMFAPVLLLGMIEHVFLKEFSWKKIKRNALFGICSLVGTLLFLSIFNITTVIMQYRDTMSSYPYATVNAYNFWGMLGQNWMSQDQIFLGIPYSSWGYAGIIGGFSLISFVWFHQIRHKRQNNYFYLAAIFLFTVFTFSVRMHERYLFPIIILLLFAYLYTKKIHILIFALLISLVHYLNVIHVYYFFDISNYDPKDFAVISISMLTVLLYLSFIVFAMLELKNGKTADFGIKKQKEAEIEQVELE